MKIAFRRAHRRIWIGLGILLPLTALLVFSMKQDRTVDYPAVLLEKPEVS